MPTELIHHPLIEHKISIMRRGDCTTAKFHRLMREIGMFMGFEMTKNLDLTSEEIRIYSDNSLMNARFVNHDEIVAIYILRAGLVLAEGVQLTAPLIRTGHMGFKRINEKTHAVKPYLVALPPLNGRKIFIVDTVIGSGQTMNEALSIIIDNAGDVIQELSAISILVTEQGLERISNKFPDINIYAFSKEKGLDPNGYVYPGFGDEAGRVYGYYE